MLTVQHDGGARRFFARVGGVAYLAYEREDDAIDLKHTVVPASARGRGVGAALARAAREYARDEGLRVIPSCPFVKSFLATHGEYGDVVAPGP